MKTILTLISLLLIKNLAYSQNDFRPGFIITHESDSIYGLIDYTEGARAFATCVFKKQGGDDILNYQPVDISGYGFLHGKYFESKIIQKADSSSESVFLQVVIHGVVSLYKNKKYFFVEKEGVGIFQLNNDQMKSYDNGHQVIRNSNKHIAILNMLMFDCSQVTSRFQKISLAERPLTILVKGYNKCIGTEIDPQEMKESSLKIIPGISAGINVSNLEFSADIPGYKHLIGDYTTSKLALAGLTFELLDPRISERFSFKGSVFYMPTNYYLLNYTSDSRSKQINYITVKVNQLKIPIGLSYTLPEKFIAPYLNLGISSTIHLTTTSKWTREVEMFNEVNTYSTEAVSFKKNQLGYWGGIGVAKSINSLISASLEFRYEKTNGVIHTPVGQGELRSTVVNYQILMTLKYKN